MPLLLTPPVTVAQASSSAAQHPVAQGELASGAGGDDGFMGDEEDGHPFVAVQRRRLAGSPPPRHFHRQCLLGHWMICSNWAMSAGRSSVSVSHRMS